MFETKYTKEEITPIRKPLKHYSDKLYVFENMYHQQGYDKLLKGNYGDNYMKHIVKYDENC